MVTLSPKALNHILELMVEGGITPDTHNLRVGVKGGGCSGLSYVMDFDDKIEPTDEVVQADWENPNASRTCGCGESFSL